MSAMLAALAVYFILLNFFGMIQHDVYNNNAVSKRWALWLFCAFACIGGCAALKGECP